VFAKGETCGWKVQILRKLSNPLAGVNEICGILFCTSNCVTLTQRVQEHLEVYFSNTLDHTMHRNYRETSTPSIFQLFSCGLTKCHSSTQHFGVPKHHSSTWKLHFPTLCYRKFLRGKTKRFSKGKSKNFFVKNQKFFLGKITKFFEGKSK